MKDKHETLNHEEHEEKKKKEHEEVDFPQFNGQQVKETI